MEPVLHMEMDIRNENFVLYSSTSSMFTMDLNGNVIYQLADVNDNNNIHISLLISFAQLNRNSVLLVDIHEHCIKLLDRVQNTTENLIGTCGTKGHRDGLFGVALFNYPSSVVPHPKRSTFYLAENFYIRRIELHVINRVFTELHHEAHVILGLVIDFDNNLGYYSTPYRIHRINMANSKLTIAELNEAKDVGDTDGPLKKTKFNSPNHLALLDPSTILLIDSRNSRLRVLNLNDHSSSSICKGSTVIQDVYGHFSECHLPNASSIMPLPFSNKVLIGDQGAIVQLELHFTGEILQSNNYFLSISIMTSNKRIFANQYLMSVAKKLATKIYYFLYPFMTQINIRKQVWPVLTHHKISRYFASK